MAGPFSGLYAFDGAWRTHPDHEVLLSYERVVVGCPCLYIPEARVLVDTDHEALMLGYHRSRLGSGLIGFVEGRIGLGRIMPHVKRGLETSPFAEPRIRTGLALGASAGVLLVPPPGPVGFLLAVRHSHVIAAVTRAHAIAVTLGLVIHPR